MSTLLPLYSSNCNSFFFVVFCQFICLFPSTASSLKMSPSQFKTRKVIIPNKRNMTIHLFFVALGKKRIFWTCPGMWGGWWQLVCWSDRTGHSGNPDCAIVPRTTEYYPVSTVLFFPGGQLPYLGFFRWRRKGRSLGVQSFSPCAGSPKHSSFRIRLSPSFLLIPAINPHIVMLKKMVFWLMGKIT